jgi:translation elongation factor EF-4
MKKERKGVNDLLDSIVEYVPSPQVDVNGELKMLIS